MEEKVFNKGDVIIREGDFGTTFFQIVEGTAGVYLRYGETDQQKLADMTAGQFVGEMGVIENWPRSSTVVAEDTVRAIEIGEDTLDVYFKEQPDKIFALMKQLGRRIREMTASYDEVNAFIREKQEAGAEKKEGFLAKLKKYREISELNNKNTAVTFEEKVSGDAFSSDKQSSRVLNFNEGQIIFREGDTGSFMYAVHGGSVGIYVNYGTKQEKLLTTLYADSFFGEMGLIENEPRSATAVVAEDNTVLECIREEDLETLFQENPAKIYMIVSHLSQRLRGLTKDYMRACETAAAEK